MSDFKTAESHNLIPCDAFVFFGRLLVGLQTKETVSNLRSLH